MIGGLIRSAGWLGTIQVLNYALPILTLPVVTRAFGPTIYGSLATINAFAAYAGLVVTFGFNFTGPRLVVKLRYLPEELSDALSAAVAMQLAVGTIAVAGFMTVLGLDSQGAEYKLVSAIILLQTCFNSITPDWAFLGLERMRDFAVLQMIARGLGAACVVAVIRTPGDVVLYVAINGVVAGVVAAISFALLQRAGVRWRIPTFAATVATGRHAAGLFLSTVLISLYTSTNVIIVNLVLGPSAAGPFALADRLRFAAGNVTGPITNAVYPFVCRISAQPVADEEAWAKRVFFQAILALSALLSLGLFVFAPAIIFVAGGSAFADAVTILRILAVIPFLIALSNILGVQTMMPLGMDWHAAWIFAATAVVGIVGMFMLTAVFGLRGAAYAAVASEVFVTLTMIMVLRRRVNILSLFLNVR